MAWFYDIICTHSLRHTIETQSSIYSGIADISSFYFWYIQISRDIKNLLKISEIIYRSQKLEWWYQQLNMWFH